ILFTQLPPLLGVWGQLGLDPSTFSCTILEKNGTSPKKMIFLIGFVLPCIVIIVSYSCIFFRVKKTRKKLMSHVKSSSSQESRRTNREKEDNRLTKLMLLIFICFLLCFLPLMIMNVFDDSINYPVLHVVASIMAWASSVINPFIYAASNRQYRTAYSKFFTLLKGNVLQTHNNTRNSMKNSQHFSNKMQPSSNTKE
ncbi:protein trapped in endoderm-1-like, partial [Agrilus planipennis]|uniref:Protein trapped in endoderm-1-like n=1 Tax=Agrilus planipennis TaxID=224129 RepID=A0A1W4XRG5_AGRPL